MLTLKSPNSTVSTVIKEGDQVKENGLVETPRPSEVTVLKAGYVKKLKTNKRKYFVLYKAGVKENDGDVWLDYFDNEKKCSKRRSSKAIVIKDCFSINKRATSLKDMFAIVLYTRTDSFSMLFEEENEMKQWLDTLVQHSTRTTATLCNGKGCEEVTFDEVWQVNIVKKGLACENPILLDKHRLCLTSSSLFMYKVEEHPSQAHEFPLTAIRKCGHSVTYFCIEFGRSSSLGCGELWMQAEDVALAGQMHEAIRNAMMSSKVSEEVAPITRPRSASTSDSLKNIASSRRPTLSSINSSHGHFSSLNGAQSSLNSGPQTSSTSASSVRDRSYSMHDENRSRTRTVSEGYPGHQYSDVSTGGVNSTAYHYSSCLHGRNQSYSPPSHNPLSPSSGACSTDSAGSSHSINGDYVDSAHSGESMNIGHTARDICSGYSTQPPPIKEEDNLDDDYMCMTPGVEETAFDRTSSFGSSSAQQQLNLRDSLSLSLPQNVSKSQSHKHHAGYSPLPSPSQTSGFSVRRLNEDQDEYMTMSPGSVENGSYDSRRSSSILDRSLNYDDGENSYLEMKPGDNCKLSTIVSSLDEGYLDMTPLSSSLPKGQHILSSSPRGMNLMANTQQVYTTPLFNSPPKFTAEEFPLEKVKSYFSPSDDESLNLIKPARAYSIGSRPQIATLNKSSSRIHAGPSKVSSKNDNSNSPYIYASPLSDVQNINAASASEKRIRAHSMGSHQMDGARDRLKARVKPTLESVLGTIKQLEENIKTEKSSSAPLLLAAEAHRARSSTCGSRIALLPVKKSNHKVAKPEDREDLMEIDYTKQSAEHASEERVRRMSLTARPRTNASNSRSSSSSSGLGSTNATSPPVSFMPVAVAEEEKRPAISEKAANPSNTCQLPTPSVTQQDVDDPNAEILTYAVIEFENGQDGEDVLIVK